MNAKLYRKKEALAKISSTVLRQGRQERPLVKTTMEKDIR